MAAYLHPSIPLPVPITPVAYAHALPLPLYTAVYAPHTAVYLSTPLYSTALPPYPIAHASIPLTMPLPSDVPCGPNDTRSRASIA